MRESDAARTQAARQAIVRGRAEALGVEPGAGPASEQVRTFLKEVEAEPKRGGLSECHAFRNGRGGRKARERRAAELRAEAELHGRELEDVRTRRRALERLVEDGEALLAE
jgi:hypothetical protein